MISRQGRIFAAIAAAVITLRVQPAGAVRYMPDEEAYAYVLGEGVQLAPETRTLSEPQAKALTDYCGIPAAAGDKVEIQVGRRDGSVTGYALMLTEHTRYRPITFAVSIGPDGKVMKSVVVVYREPRGEQVKSERFNRQFEGKSQADTLKVGGTIRAVSGATVSAEVMTMGVKKALFLVNEFFLKSPPSGEKPS